MRNRRWLWGTVYSGGGRSQFVDMDEMRPTDGGTWFDVEGQYHATDPKDVLYVSIQVLDLTRAEGLFRFLAATCWQTTLSAHSDDWDPNDLRHRSIINPSDDVRALFRCSAPPICTGGRPLPIQARERRQEHRGKRSPIINRIRRDINAGKRARILERDGFRCRRCGSTAADERLDVDHIVPVARGGTSDEANLQTLCMSCNAGKKDRDPHEADLVR